MGTINLDPPEDFLEAERLDVLIDRWLAEKRAAPATLDAYRCKIAHFRRWWGLVGPANGWRLTESSLLSFEVHLRSVTSDRFGGAPLSYNTRHAIVRTLRIMFKWAFATGKTTKHYGEWVPWPSGAPPKRRAATVEQLARLMMAAGESRQPLRDMAILAFFIGTGCRRGEVAGLSVEDLTILADCSGTALVTGKRTKANKTGQRVVAFDASTGRLLVRYMDVLLIHNGPLWINDDGNKFQQMSIYSMIKRVIARAELDEYIQGPHDLRRAFATILRRMQPDNPMWADMIRRQLGHAHYSQTADYTLLDAEDIRDSISSPLALVRYVAK